jgi:hypothetical protein
VVIPAAQGSWSPAWHCTVIGAAHRRRGVVCQDASLVRRLRSPTGASLQLLAVADGHGGQRYRFSDTGSRLACEQAAAAVQAALRATPLDNQHAWRLQLRHGLPDAIQAGWLQAVRRHWQRQAAAAGQPFHASLYGSTLGLVLLAPGWWGCTGLGDWDLVRVGSDGGSTLLSEEASHPAAGEATASLCLASAGPLWAQRARLQPLGAAECGFALVLSTDGVRKSCATDGDFLELCSQMVQLQDSPRLAQGLAEISAGGSGDDLSIAVGHRCGPSPPQEAAAPRPLRPLVLGLPVALALGAAAWLAWPQPWSWFPARPWSAGRPEPLDPRPWIRRESERLCRTPDLIAATLAQRKEQFRRLEAGDLSRQALLAAAPQDPLGALVGWSQPAAAPRPFPPPGSCAALDQSLAQRWRELALADRGTPPGPAPLPAPQPAPLPAPNGGGEEGAMQAIASVQGLYRELAAGPTGPPSGRLHRAAADQFDPVFFAQFNRVDVGALEVIGRTGSRLALQGVVTWIYPDGSSQRETRSYAVDMANDPPLIVHSAFGRVINPRH